MAQASKPKRVILFIIDGIHWQAPEKLKMPAFNSLIGQGTYINRSYVIIPHHPTTGDYSKFNTSSFPNPVMQEGTLFLSTDNKMIQECFASDEKTLFVVNQPTAYRSIGRGFSTLIMDGTLSDSQLVDKAIEIIDKEDHTFVRIHLQTAGTEGYKLAQATPDKPYFRDIYGKDSPYAAAIENADKALSTLLDYLKKSGKFDDTLLIITSDHGQSLVGWHPLFDADSWLTPTLFVGPDIAKGRKLPYFEHTDIAPTIAGLMGKQLPCDGGSGLFVKEVLSSVDASGYKPKEYVRKFNEQIKEFNLLRAKMIVASEKNAYYANIVTLLENETFTEPFYTQDRVTEWYKAKSMDNLLSVNEKILTMMRDALNVK